MRTHWLTHGCARAMLLALACALSAATSLASEPSPA